MTSKYGETQAGKSITDETIDQLAMEAERGYDVDRLVVRRGKRGRPALGNGASTVESVRLDADMKKRLLTKAKQQGVSVSHIIREALDQHLRAS